MWQCEIEVTGVCDPSGGIETEGRLNCVKEQRSCWNVLNNEWDIAKWSQDVQTMFFKCSHHVVYYIPLTYLFYIGKLEHLEPNF